MVFHSLRLRASMPLPPDIFTDIKAVIASHATTHESAPPLELQWLDGAGKPARLRSRTLRIPTSQALLNDLRALLGEEGVSLVNNGS